MPGSPGLQPELRIGTPSPWGTLTDKDYELIDLVVEAVLRDGMIPNMNTMAANLGISRQAVLQRMSSAAQRGIMEKRPRYAVRWLELTELGEQLYVERRAKSSR